MNKQNETTKSPAMVKALDAMSKQAFGISRTEAKEGATCVFCKKSADKFTDKLSKTEYGISGLCQVCQDEVFN
tara:strand:- start:3579 stop:3797 length:219 start_codon:yes stop_codon:yes gene_type:complete